MRIAHLSDLHLGFRAYEETERGWNLRERDLAAAYRWALQEVARLDPGIVLIAGDVFDRPDPPSTALLTATRGLAGLRGQLPGVPVLVIAGGRDSPRNPADPGPVAVLDALPGVDAAAGAPRAVRLRANGLHVLLVPYRATVSPPFPEIRPDPDAKWNVLMIRGVPSEGDRIPVDPNDWDYVAVGGPHVQKSWAEHVRATGALERPGWDPWSKTLEERGFTIFDLDRGNAEFHPVPGRAVVDLAPVRVASDDRDAGSRRLRELLQGVPGGIRGKLLRISLRGDIVAPGDAVAPGLLEAVRVRAAHLEIELRGSDREPVAPDGERTGGGVAPPWIPQKLELGLDNGSGPGGPGESLRIGGGGITLVTAESEALRQWLAVRLGAPIGDGTSDSGRLPAFRIRPDLPDSAVLRALWAGERDPGRLIDLILQSGLGDPNHGDAGRPGGEARAHGPAREEPLDREGRRGILGVFEVELRELRGDSIEASGDLEARTLEWARERQDAESNLQAYRTKARELQERIRQLERDGADAECPTCGQAMGAGLEDLLLTLRGELEGVVQDGSWWRSRREQLEEKPADLQSLEARALRLHAQVEAAAERLQRARDGAPVEGAEWRRSHAAGPSDPSTSGSPSEAAAGELGPRWGSEAWSRGILREASNWIARVTQGRLEAVGEDTNGWAVVEKGGGLRPAVGGERAALAFAVHLAVRNHVRARGHDPGGLLLWEFHRSGTEDLALPALELAVEMSEPEIPVIVVAPPTLIERLPEVFGEVVELGRDASGRLGFRRQAMGVPSLSLRGSDMRVR